MRRILSCCSYSISICCQALGETVQMLWEGWQWGSLLEAACEILRSDNEKVVVSQCCSLEAHGVWDCMMLNAGKRGQEDLPPCWHDAARPGTTQQRNSGSLYVSLLSRTGTFSELHCHKALVWLPLSKFVFTDRRRQLLELCSAAKCVLGKHGGAGHDTAVCSSVTGGRGRQDFHL